ncbi:hypothetical protein QBC34DRAFT_412229 [Podospora aff. communis PSN243]|uniref:T6SS Phospholipase effector Tle1-like catalytic domain-containing protein n=1 Tax=Podospora aff. communis PSN243 TaxID=3040156 RepID=A0AAV9GCW8_9PEZI|nr:hypothetical protein QBC34DRAFT_412229 [Podospora aff. communis PSN243]
MSSFNPNGKLAKGAVRCAHIDGVLPRKGEIRPSPNTKRLIVCCDGTWNNTNDNTDPASNVSRLSSAFARSCCSGMPQVIYYHPGAGTEKSKVAKFLGGAFGHGVPQDIAETYRFICDNYRPDDELFLIGFSRGAFTARSIAGMVCGLGFLNRAGIEQLPHIFHDYTHWSSWTRESQFNGDIHLQAFTLKNMEQNEQVDVLWKNIKSMRKSKGGHPAATTAWAGGAPGSSRGANDSQSQLSLESEVPAPPKLEVARSSRELKTELENDKRKLFRDIVAANRANEPDRAAKVAGFYRSLLGKHGLLMTSTRGQKAHSSLRPGFVASPSEIPVTYGIDESLTSHTKVAAGAPEGENGDEPEHFPMEGKVRAIGVWDTVGGLGIPKTPLTRSTRRAREMQFESLHVHSKVEYAFHAIALDEWRTAFQPTMWGKRENHDTKLRQVWFPGNHGNVGGGWEDQQIATIALAWMADQLTPLGVEFSRNEMERIFSSVSPEGKVLPWGMGTIYNPHGFTTYFDRAFNLLATPYRMLKKVSNHHAPRTPGRYRDDDNTTLLQETEEFVHPSVRIRYLYSGRGLDDHGIWDCRSLVGPGGYTLRPSSVDSIVARPGRSQTKGKTAYHCVVGTAVPYYGDVPKDRPKTFERMLVRVERPNWFRIGNALESLLPAPKQRWDWVSNSDGERRLEEEHLGVWEQKFIYVNDTLWKKQVASKNDAGTGADTGVGAQTEPESGGFVLRQGFTLPDGYPDKYSLFDVFRWENWDMV